jgi:hypothetical protein
MGRSVFCCLILLLGGCVQLTAGIRATDRNDDYPEITQTRRPDGHGISGSDIFANLRSPSDRPLRSPECVVALAFSGGGSISAAYAYGALYELLMTLRGPSPVVEADYLSSASGGGIAAGVLHELMMEPVVRCLEEPHGRDCDVVRPCFQSGWTGPSCEKANKIVLQYGSRNAPGEPNAVDGVDWARASRCFELRDPARVSTQALLSCLLEEPTYAASLSERFIGKRHLASGGGVSRLEQFQQQLPVGLYGKEHAAPSSQGFRQGFRTMLHHRAYDVKIDATSDDWSRLSLWIPNATSFANGARVPMTAPVLASLLQPQVPTPRQTLAESSAVIGADKKLMTYWLSASMSFPGIGPFALQGPTVGGRPTFLHLVDGGLSDNLGMKTALEGALHELGVDAARWSRTAQPRAKRGLVIVFESTADAGRGFLTTAGKVDATNLILDASTVGLWSQHEEASRVAQAYALAATGLLGGGDILKTVFLRARDVQGEIETCTATDFGPPGLCSTVASKKPVLAYLNGLASTAALTRENAAPLLQLGRAAVQAKKAELQAQLDWCFGVSAEPSASSTVSSLGR